PSQPSGCGASFQYSHPERAGYLPPPTATSPSPTDPASLPMDALTPAEVKKILRESGPSICRRCHNLSMNKAPGTTRTFPDPNKAFSSVRIRPDGLFIVIVDVSDFPGSFVRNMDTIIGTGKRMILVANKSDALPDWPKRPVVGAWLRAETAKMGYKKWVDVIVTSAMTGVGLGRLVEVMRSARGRGETVYLVGCANVGKSALLAALQKKGGVTTPVKLTTSIHPGTTAGMIAVPFEKLGDLMLDREDEDPDFPRPLVLPPPDLTGQIIDTPGIFNPDQVTHLLNDAELRLVLPKRDLKPHQYHVNPGRSILVGGLFRLDHISGDPLVITTYCGPFLPIHKCRTDKADNLRTAHLGLSKRLLTPPLGANRAARFPPLRVVLETLIVGPSGPNVPELTLPGVGWMTFTGKFERAEIKVYAPGETRVFLRGSLMDFAKKIMDGKALVKERVAKEKEAKRSSRVEADILARRARTRVRALARAGAGAGAGAPAVAGEGAVAVAVAGEGEGPGAGEGAGEGAGAREGEGGKEVKCVV
ncbi:P-loop containing nucleoside triphosphate hydrolase protein, partial [Blyttiomyces helicus]